MPSAAQVIAGTKKLRAKQVSTQPSNKTRTFTKPPWSTANKGPAKRATGDVSSKAIEYPYSKQQFI
jgi:hypothetical protein